MVVKMNNRELRQFVNSQADDSRKYDALYEAYERIRQLEELNKVLAAEVDRMRPVVEAAEYYKRCNPYLPVSSSEKRLLESVVTYQASKPK